MLSISVVLTLAAAGTWVGAILFQSAIVAPSVFSVLDEAAARRFLRRLFPRFFRLGVVCSGLSLVGAVAASAASSWARPFALAIALSMVTLVLAVLALRMIPATNAARDAGDTGAARFATLHRLSVAATLAMLASSLGIVAVVGTASVS